MQVGVLSELPDSIVRTKARLEPGKMFLVDFDKGDIIPDSGASIIYVYRGSAVDDMDMYVLNR